MNNLQSTQDYETAQAFSTSWNNLPQGSVYNREQVLDWLSPLTPEDFKGKKVLELGCGNGSIMYHIAQFEPKHITGVDLGDSVQTARQNMASISPEIWSIEQGDLTTFESEGFDIVYCIGVLHHLKTPLEGFRAVLRNTKLGGRFHCWVYAYEGNAIVRGFVDPLRRLCSRFPWWLTKYGVATPLAIPFWIYAKTIR